MVVTKADLDDLKEWIDIAVDEKLDKVIETKIATKDDISHLPSKDDFYKETARLLSKMEDIEDSITILNNRTSDHSDKLEKLEKIHPQYAHASI